MLHITEMEGDEHDRPSRCPSPVSSARSNTMLVAFFVVALFATIVAMHRGVTRGANAELRARFDAEGPRGELSRRLMRDAGYRV
ncbi:hypothetical protein KDX08_01065 [Burkholderia cenocepacia]|uniref:hypothetical protein n=1 Tax=Burkholderia cenocepacia TaxID=95486 RepID=UPI0012AEC470|nr:hypothetical protein [Burkholderia cenocepacia]MBR7991023.1 hypothetical protein [Burkholderia cenocepacia]